MKKIFAVFLAFSILSQSLVNVGIGIYYHLNKTYITRQLCENKNNPKLHCNGHCYLSKQLKKAQEGESKSAQFIKEKEEIIANQISALPFQYFPDFKVSKFRFFDSFPHLSGASDPALKPPIA